MTRNLKALGSVLALMVASYTGGGTSHGTVDIECAGANEIAVTVAGPMGSFTHKCTIHIPAQNGIGSVKYKNIGMGAAREVTVEILAVTGIAYSQTKGTGLGACATTGVTKNGLYLGTEKVKGETDPGSTQTGIWVE